MARRRTRRLLVSIRHGFRRGGLLAVQIAVAAGAVYAVMALIAHYTSTLRDTRSSQTWDATVTVTNRAIGIGETIEEADLVDRPFRLEYAPDEAVLGRAELVGRVADERILPGELVRSERLAPAGVGAGFSALLGAGRRAFELTLAGADRVSGFIQADDHVDVVVTLIDLENGEAPTTETVIVGARVLSVAEFFDPDATASQQQSERITLDLDPASAERLSYAARTGRLRLVLRSPLDFVPIAAGALTLPRVAER